MWQTEGVCHGPGNSGAGGLYSRRGSAACEAGEGRRAGAKASCDRGGGRWGTAGRGGEERGGMDRQTLRDWVIRFNGQGPDGLINIPSPGVPPKLDDTHKAFLARLVEDGPIPAVDGVVRWRACDLIMRLYAKF